MELHHLAEYPSAQLRVYFLTSPKPGAGVLVRSQRDPVNAAEAVDAIGFHLFLPL